MRMLFILITSTYCLYKSCSFAGVLFLLFIFCVDLSTLSTVPNEAVVNSKHDVFLQLFISVLVRLL